jgi:hypothetical protein
MTLPTMTPRVSRSRSFRVHALRAILVFVSARTWTIRAAAASLALALVTLAGCASSSGDTGPSCRPRPGVYDVTFSVKVDAATDAGADCPPRDPTTWTVNADGTAGPDVAPPLGNGQATFVQYTGSAAKVAGAWHCDLGIHGEEPSPVCEPSTARVNAIVSFTGDGTAAGSFIVTTCTDHYFEACTYDVAATVRP